RALELAPGFRPARYQLAVLLHRRNEPADALAEVERLLAADSRNPGYRNLAAVILSRVGEYERSSRMYAELVQEYPSNAKVWLSYGHVLKTEGRLDESIAAYRRSIAHDPAFGEAWWSLANLKTFRFAASDLAAMRRSVDDPAVDEANRVHLHFALGKALEDAGDYAASFEHYANGNALHRARHPYDAGKHAARVRRFEAVFTAKLFASRAGGGCPDGSPIFIVGMPRAGSTLLEQILGSHSAVEGTTELPEIITLARELRELAEDGDIGSYADVLAAMEPGALRELGERFLERTRVHRKTGRPHFIDKMPNNFLHVAMIHLALPSARIIDARRHPVA
ncbi:MAG: sulfotransferase, partial [Geminicoccales bacterium]